MRHLWAEGREAGDLHQWAQEHSAIHYPRSNEPIINYEMVVLSTRITIYKLRLAQLNKKKYGTLVFLYVSIALVSVADGAVKHASRGVPIPTLRR